jgi:hypothetical protein
MAAAWMAAAWMAAQTRAMVIRKKEVLTGDSFSSHCPSVAWLRIFVFWSALLVVSWVIAFWLQWKSLLSLRCLVVHRIQWCWKGIVGDGFGVCGNLLLLFASENG